MKAPPPIGEWFAFDLGDDEHRKSIVAKPVKRKASKTVEPCRACQVYLQTIHTMRIRQATDVQAEVEKRTTRLRDQLRRVENENMELLSKIDELQNKLGNAHVKNKRLNRYLREAYCDGADE